MLMAQGACRLAGCDSAQQGGQPAAGAGPIMHPDVPGLGLHLFLGTESHRGDCLLRGARPLPSCRETWNRGEHLSQATQTAKHPCKLGPTGPTGMY